MSDHRNYDILPRTFKARLLLAMAFLGSLAVFGIWFAIYALGFDGSRDPAPPCTGSQREGCHQAQTELDPIAQLSCVKGYWRVCFVPLGQVDPQLVRNLVQYYGDEYGLEIGVLTPSAVPLEMSNPDRDQIDGELLTTYMATLLTAEPYAPNAALIGLTPLDLYTEDQDWNFLLGHAVLAEQPLAIVSTYRMNLGKRGLVDDERVFSRTRKLVTKYVGSIVYGFPLSDDPKSAMYGNILSVLDLDEMEEPLTVPSR